MIKILFTGAAGIIFLVGTSFLFVWMGERAKKRAKQKLSKRFQHFDKYYSELEKESEKELEKTRKERMTILGYKEVIPNKESENIDIARFSSRSAI